MNRPLTDRETWQIKLFVAGSEPHSQAARRNIEKISQSLEDPVNVEIVDVFHDFAAAARHNVLVTPTLVAVAPGRELTFIGHLDNCEEICEALRNEGAPS